MYAAHFIQGCMSILGSLAFIAITLTALATIIGLVKPNDAVKYSFLIAGILIVTILIVSVLVGLWGTMSVWQKLVLAAIGFGVWRLRTGHRAPRKKSDGE